MKRNNGKTYIAVTGGIGSGKSTVMRMIEGMGFPVLSADAAARNIYDEPDVRSAAEKAFPDCFEGGVLDRKKLAERVFSDKEKLALLDSITHPAVMKKLFAEAERARGDYVFFEVPLLFEGGYEGLFDHVIVVLRDRAERIAAVVLRDGLSEKEVAARINNQAEHEKNCKAGHTVICNDGDLPTLQRKVNGAVHDITTKKS